MSFTTLYAGLATTAVVGIAAPVLLPLDLAAKTPLLLASLAASGTLTALHATGEVKRQSAWRTKQRDSHQRVREERLTSAELRETIRLEAEDLREILVALDDCTPQEQVYFLKKLDLLELLPVYNESRMQREALPAAVDVQARKVEESPFGNEKLSWAVDSVIAQSSQPAEQPAVIDDTFEEVDLGKAIAEMMVGGDVPLSVMLACPPRTGKTTLMTVTLAWLHKLTQGNADIKIFNGKENRDQKTGQLKDRFLGLVDDPSRYQSVESLEAAKDFAEEFDDVAQGMNRPRQHPQVIFLDEHNNIRARIHGYDQLNGIPKNKGYLNRTDVNVGLIATQGSSRGLFLLITSHSAYVKNIGIDRSYQDGLYSIVLGRGGALDGLYKSLKGASAVVQNSTRANQLLLELQQWEQSPTRDHSKVVALTNLVDGNFGLYFAKYIDLSKVRFEPVTSEGSPAAEDPYEFWDEDFEEDQGHQPEDDPDWEATRKPEPAQPKPPVGNPIADAKDSKSLNDAIQESQRKLVALLLAWINELGHVPSDAELKAKLKEVLGSDASDTVMKGIKYLLAQHGIKFD